MKVKINNQTISFVISTLTVGLAFLSFIDSSFGTKALLVGILLALLNLRNRYLIQILPSMLFCFVVLFLLLVSGQISVRGFNAPINHAMKFVYMFCAFSVAIIMKDFSDKQKRIIILTGILSAVISSVISSYFALTKDVYAIRYASERGYNSVADFNQIYAITILLVVIAVSILSQRRKKSLLLILSIICMGVCISASLFSTAILLVIMGIGIAWFFNSYRESPRRVILIVCFLFVMLLMIYIFNNQISDFIYNITERMNWVVRDRLRSVADSLLGTDHGISYSYDRRDELAWYSLTSFLKHPLLGVGYVTYGYGVIGCHQEWQDLLGVFGIMGSCIVIIIFILMSRFIWKKSCDNIDRMSFLIALLLLFVLGFLNPCLSIPVLIVVFVIAPNVKVLSQKL